MDKRDKDNLRRIVSNSITRTFKSALEELEVFISSIASQMDDNDVEKLRLRHEKLAEAQELIRKRILRAGNNEIRAIVEELDGWTVKQDTPSKYFHDVYVLNEDK